jgi:hypothetical protein
VRLFAIIFLVCLSSIGCGGGLGAVGCGSGGGAARQDAAARPAGQPATQPGAAAATGEIAIDVADAGSTLDVGIQLDAPRAVRRVLSRDGGTLTATADDGSTFTLTIPEDALVGREEIILTPVSGMTGLPDGVTLAAGVQMAPEGLLLLQPATLTIEPASRVAPDQEVAFGWTRDGHGVHAHFPALEPSVPTFQVTHFSGAGVAAGSAGAAGPIVRGRPLPCAGQFFGELAALAGRARQSALSGTATGDEAASLGEAFIRVSRGYLQSVLEPVVNQAATDDLLLPCAAAGVYSWERQAQLLLGESFEATFGDAARALHQSLFKGVATSFSKSYERCMRNESPLFQLGRMTGAARQLQMMNLGDLLPADHVQQIMSCGRRFDYRVDVESEVENVYNDQGQGADIASSKTLIKASGIVAKFDEKRSAADGPIFTAAPVNAEATATIVPRNPCPDLVRVEPGSKLGVTVEPILNPRIGQLRCERGKARCDATDTNPGVLVHLAPHVIESAFLHTYSGGRCDDEGSWNEFMMFFTGRMSAGADEPFQVRGEQDARAVVRHGSRTRRQYLDVAPGILKMNPQMKNYAEIDTPVIKTATDRTRVSIQVQRR